MRAKKVNEAIVSPEIEQALDNKINILKNRIEKKDSEYDRKLLKTLEEIKDGTRPLTLKNHVHVGEQKDGTYKVFQDGQYIAKQLNKIIKKYKKYEADDSSTPSAPNTGVFKAHISGKIWGIVNDYLRAGYYGVNRNYVIGVKIGGGIPLDINRKIKEEVYQVLFPYEEYNGGDGGVMIDDSTGTNYDTIGLACSKYSFNKGIAEKLLNVLNG